MLLGRHPSGRYSVITGVQKPLSLRALAVKLGCLDPERETLTD
jgi:hypothetical protein